MAVSEVSSVQELLPKGYEYKFPESPIYSSVSDFKAVIRTTIENEDEAEQWRKDFQENCKMTWRLQSGKVAKGKVNVYKRYFRCQHNTMPRSESADKRMASKNKNCPATMIITVKRTQFKKKSRATVPDPYLPEYPCQIEINNNHNHLIHTAECLRERDVSEEINMKLLELFEKGHSPASALESIKTDMQISEGSNYAFAAADRAICPDIGYCFRLYYKIFSKSYGAPSGEQMVEDLEHHISEFNLEKGEDCARVTTVGKDLVVAVCTPLMKRAHSLIRQSGEMVFIDASGGVDRHHCRIFLLWTHSCAGGVPLGCFITTSESREVIGAGLNLLKDVLPSGAFAGRGPDGPEVFLSNDSSAERGAIGDIYPKSTLLLCSFHLLQASWRYIWDAKNGIAKQDRPHLLSILKMIVYADSSDALQQTYNNSLQDEVVLKYESYRNHLQGIYDRRKEWAVCLHEELPTRGNHTNNYVEAAMKVLKDKVFVRTRAFNVVQLLDFILTRFEAYYERRFIDVANNRLDMTLSKRFLPTSCNIEQDNVTKMSENLYRVQSESQEDTTYFVDTTLSLCTCFVGKTGAPCKHQHAVVKYFGVDSVNVVPVNSPFMRGQFLQLATGQNAATSEAEKPATCITEQIMQAASNICQRVVNNPSLVPSAKKFVAMTGDLHTDSALDSALAYFGRYTSLNLKGTKTKLKMVHGAKIGVQPTAIACRVSKLGGRKCIKTGRKPKHSNCP